MTAHRNNDKFVTFFDFIKRFLLIVSIGHILANKNFHFSECLSFMLNITNIVPVDSFCECSGIFFSHES